MCYDKVLKEENPEYAARQRANYKEWVEQNGERIRTYTSTYKGRPRVRKRLRHKAREYKLARYGLTWEDEKRILEAQGGGCGVCGGPPQRPHFDVDHDHDTGKVRGLLCGRCNKGLGLLGDSLEGLQKAVRYLQGAVADDGKPSERHEPQSGDRRDEGALPSMARDRDDPGGDGLS